MKLYLAGVESLIEPIKYAQPPYILFSFAACRGSSSTQEKVMELTRCSWCKDFLCDSGAFTFFTKGHTVTLDEWSRYVDEYIEFINDNNIHYFFELDIDKIVGINKVEEIRKRIEKRTGKQCIPVWHISRGWKYFERMCDEYKYVSLGGIVSSRSKKYKDMFPWFIDYAHKKDVKIHGLGYTDTRMFKQYQFDSIDSTTWTVGGRFGEWFDISGNTLIRNGKNINRKNKRIDGVALHNHNAAVWAQYARILDI